MDPLCGFLPCCSAPGRPPTRPLPPTISNQGEHPRVADAMLHKCHRPLVVEGSEEVLQVRLEHPAHAHARNEFVARRQGVMRSSPRSSAKRAIQEIVLIDGVQHLRRGPLPRPVDDRWHPQNADTSDFLRDFHCLDRRRENESKSLRASKRPALLAIA